ncbi:hypothetical protein LTR27_012170 [Elasticomyces elasticus]|nr:hypothetical protein LTR27_012170 [Elasticomyces elasticus]
METSSQVSVADLGSPKHLIQEAEALEEKASSLRQLAHRRQTMNASVHDVQQHVALPQQMSQPSNPNQLAFGELPTLKSGWAYQFDPLTIFHPDGTLRTGLTSSGGEFGTWDPDIQLSQLPGQHRLDFSVPSPGYQTQQQDSIQKSTLPGRSNQGSDSSASSTGSTGLGRMQKVFYTRLEAAQNAAARTPGAVENQFRAYHLHDDIGL